MALAYEAKALRQYLLSNLLSEYRTFKSKPCSDLAILLRLATVIGDITAVMSKFVSRFITGCKSSRLSGIHGTCARQ